MQSLEVKWNKGTLALEAQMLKEEQVSVPVVHRFGPGIYIREVSFLAGTLAIGHHHTSEHVNILLKGRATMLTEDGVTWDIEAPFFYIAQPGRKVAYFYEASVWQNIFATEETDVDALEKQYLVKSPVFAESIKGFNVLKVIEDQEDFLAAIAEFGYTEDAVRELSEQTDDAVALPGGSYKFQVGDSEVEGKGLFATADIYLGDIIAPASIEGKRTIAGRYTNHAKEPNAIMVRYAGGDISLQAIQTIRGNEGGFLGDEITVDYRQVLALKEDTLCQV